ncbi:MAG: hypothetical protein QOF78_3866 [Phycisphaerales bacterium]|jgi:photosystem II stability/assembly factor-like uncharacterized protein|nr:hypothetical protein [Phycisphaerales bacterium]
MSGAITKTKLGVPRRFVLLMLAALVLVVCSVIAFAQPSYSGPGTPSFLSLDWWRHPREYQMFRQRQILTAHLTGIDVRAATDKPDEREIWITGSGGFLAVSKDGGRTWTQVELTTPLRWNEIKWDDLKWDDRRPDGADTSKGAARGIIPMLGPRVSVTGVLQATGGPRPNENTNQGDPSPARRDQPNPGPPVVPDLKSNERKETETPAATRPARLRPPVRYQLNAVTFSDANTGWAVGAGGTLAMTTDGGMKWRVNEDLLVDLEAVASVAGTIYLGGEGLILRVRPAQASGAVEGAGAGAAEADLAVSDMTIPIVALVVRPPGASLPVGISETGEIWHLDSRVELPQHDDGPQGVRAAAQAGATLWICGERGLVAHRGAEAASWTIDPSLGSQALRAIAFVDDKTGWTVGDGGVIFATRDGGKWEPQASGVTTPLRAVRTIDAKTAWAVGDYGTVLFTNDGGQKWERLTGDWTPLAARVEASTRPTTHPSTMPASIDPQRLAQYAPTRLPAPWYFLSWLIVLALVALSFIRPQDLDTVKEPTVAGHVASDKPLEPGKPDPLDFHSVAAGLSRFLRNEKTEPPLTLAITGRWGSGKSSLMNLLQADLRRFGVRPVWFNAWHHQHDERLLASLLQAIRQQAIPPWYTYEGLVFRAKLLWGRTNRYWIVMLLVGALFAWLAGYYIQHPGEFRASLGHFVTLIATAIESVINLFREGTWTWKPPDRATDLVAEGSPSIVFISSTLTLLAALSRGLTAFGANPARLVQSMSDQAKVGDLQEKANFRSRFVREFAEVTRALHPRDMLILIDDLDRCQPDHVLETLEAVNFLVSSGDCFVVLGMDGEIVEHAVAVGFAGLAKEFPFAGENPGAPDIELQRRKAFAQQYMHKLIQIRVPVPAADPKRSVHVVAPPPPLENDLNRAWRMSWRAAGAVLPALACAAIIYLCFWYGSRQHPALEQAAAAQVAAPQSPIVAPTPTTPSTRPLGTRKPGDLPRPPVSTALPQPQPHIIAPAETRSHRLLLFGIPGLLIFAGIVWAFLTRPNIVVRDSDRFTNAVKWWHPHLFADATPRSMKRFINTIRFLAMRYGGRDEDEIATPTERLRTLIHRIGARLHLVAPPPPAPPGRSAAWDEAVLVHWCALYKLSDGEILSKPAALFVHLLKWEEPTGNNRGGGFPTDPKERWEKLLEYQETFIPMLKEVDVR